MSKTVRRSHPTRTPERPSHGTRDPRRSASRKAIPVLTSAKASRFAIARGFLTRHRTSLIAGGPLGVVLLAALAYGVICVAASEPAATAPVAPVASITPVAVTPPDAEPVRAVSSAQQGVRAGVATLSPVLRRETRPFGPASALAESGPPDARGVAKRDGRSVVTSADSRANVKNDAKPPRTIAKRVVPPPTEKETPAWLWNLTRMPEAESIRKVPEVGLHTISTKTELARDFKQVLDLHKSGSDGFLGILCRERSDLAGLPFLKGDACRLTRQQEASLRATSSDIREALDDLKQRVGRGSVLNRFSGTPTSTDVKIMFDYILPTASTNSRKSQPSPAACLPATVQILGPLAAVYRIELAGRLEYPSDDKAVAAILVRLALYDPEVEVRTAAVKALALQPAESYGAKLVEGLRHPFAPVAEHAADALVSLNRVEQLLSVVDFLDEPDPSAPFVRDEGLIKQAAIREVVKVNHLRNCMLCHAPATQADTRSSSLMALVPSPDEPLPPTNLAYYSNFGPTDMVVRVNEVYLRQDFSRLEKVETPGKWPTQQRFDYLVRTRNLTPAEAAQRRPKATDGVPSPHHRAALSVLSRLTSTYLGTRSSDWRDEIARRVEEAKEAAN